MRGVWYTENENENDNELRFVWVWGIELKYFTNSLALLCLLYNPVLLLLYASFSFTFHFESVSDIGSITFRINVLFLADASMQMFLLQIFKHVTIIFIALYITFGLPPSLSLSLSLFLALTHSFISLSLFVCQTRSRFHSHFHPPNVINLQISKIVGGIIYGAEFDVDLRWWSDNKNFWFIHLNSLQVVATRTRRIISKQILT